MSKVDNLIDTVLPYHFLSSIMFVLPFCSVLKRKDNKS